MHAKPRHFNMTYFKSYFSATLPSCAQELTVSETSPSASASIKSMFCYIYYVNWKYFCLEKIKQHTDSISMPSRLWVLTGCFWQFSAVFRKPAMVNYLLVFWTCSSLPKPPRLSEAGLAQTKHRQWCFKSSHSCGGGLALVCQQVFKGKSCGFLMYWTTSWFLSVLLGILWEYWEDTPQLSKGWLLMKWAGHHFVKEVPDV